MGYHKKLIEKGFVGQFSKIKEEYEELEDAFEQDDKILQLCEMADLIGAIEAYAHAEFGVELSYILKFKDKTRQAFKEGLRK
jgi:phosphoribosyl-ATP pyrophosphohydrolase